MFLGITTGPKFCSGDCGLVAKGKNDKVWEGGGGNGVGGGGGGEGGTGAIPAKHGWLKIVNCQCQP